MRRGGGGGRRGVKWPDENVKLMCNRQKEGLPLAMRAARGKAETAFSPSLSLTNDTKSYSVRESRQHAMVACKRAGEREVADSPAKPEETRRGVGWGWERRIQREIFFRKSDFTTLYFQFSSSA